MPFQERCDILSSLVYDYDDYCDYFYYDEPCDFDGYPDVFGFIGPDEYELCHMIFMDRMTVGRIVCLAG